MLNTIEKSSKQKAIGIIFASLGAIGFSGKAIIVKLAYRYQVDPITLLMYRMLFALPFFAAMAWWASRGKPALTRQAWLGILGLGFSGYYLASFLDFMGLQYISASLERLILYLNPTLVLFFSWFLYKKQINRWQYLGMAIGYAGVVIVFGNELSLQGSHAALGAVLVFLSAISYALYLVYSGELVKQLGALRLVGYATLVACVCCLVQFGVMRPLSAAIVAPEVLGLSVMNAIFCTAVPVLLVMLAVERMGAAVTSQIGLIGPISTIFMGVLVLNEPFTWSVAVGSVLVIGGIFVFTKSPKTR